MEEVVMKKRVILSILVVLSLFMISGCDKEEKEVPKTDALTFKEEYESINGKENSSGKIYRTLNIKEDNPFIYKSAKDIVDAINNKESFIVYFGFKTCPWCRSVIETLIDVASELGIEQIYYVDVLDIRDTLEVNSKDKVITSKEGSPDYMELIKLLDNVLEDYTLSNSKGKAVDTKEKRIYAPNIVVVNDGVGVKLTTAISDKLTDSYMKLTDEILEDCHNMLESTLKESKLVEKK